jgi:hypothetical protein
MTRTILFLITIFGIWTSGHAQHSKAGTTMSRQEFLTKANSQTIKGGIWYHQQWTEYKMLNFNDSVVYINNNIDTIMPSKYNIVGDTLIIFGGQPVKPYKSKILLLRIDTLVLQGIFDTKEILGYSRKNQK